MFDFIVILGDELAESDIDEVVEGKRFPQQRVSCVTPIRARSVTPNRESYFSPVPISRPWTPDYKSSRNIFVESRRDALEKFRNSLTTETLATARSESCKRDFFDVETNVKIASDKDLDKIPANKSSRDNLSFMKCTVDNQSLCNVSSTYQLSSSSSMLSPVQNPSHIKSTSYLKKHSSEIKTAAIANVTSAPRFVFSLPDVVDKAFVGRGISYQHVLTGPVPYSFTALPFQALHSHDKFVPPLVSNVLPSNIPHSPLSPIQLSNHHVHSHMYSGISPHMSFQLHSSIAASQVLPQHDGSKYIDENKVATITANNYEEGRERAERDPTTKKQPDDATSAKNPRNQITNDKDEKVVKNILKKFVPDGMEQ